MQTIQSVSFIGAGHVASHLATALYQQNVVIRQICNRSIDSAKALANQVEATAIEDIALLEPVDCVLIAVPDDAIAQVISQVTNTNLLLAHTSGVKGLDFEYDRLGYFYPLQSFRKSVPISFSEIPIFIGAKANEDQVALKFLAQKISNRVREVSASQKEQLHLAAVVVNNFVNHLFGLTKEFLSDHQLDFTDLEPIIQTTIDRALAENPYDIQTGPAIRHDAQTIARHEELLKNYPDFLQAYQCLTKNIQEKHKL